MGQVVLFVLAVLLANVSGWAECGSFSDYVRFNQRCENIVVQTEAFASGSTASVNYSCGSDGNCSNYPITFNGVSNNSNRFLWKIELHEGSERCYSPRYQDYIYMTLYYCTTQCQADSLKGCDDEHVWNQDSCKCVPKPPTESDSTFTICDEQFLNGRTYSTIYKVTCHYRDGNLETCCGVSPSKINDTGYKSYCPIYRSNAGSCADNGVPNGPSPPHEGNQVKENMPTSTCYATVGSTCYFQDFLSGRTYSCECDGDCQKAQRDAAAGYGSCVNPYPQYSSSSAGGVTSSGSGGGGEGGDSSGSEGGNSSGSVSDKDYTQQLNQIIANTQGIMDNTADISQWTQETMNQTIDIKNQLTEYGIDFTHIRTNTENTAENTADISSKLSATNNILQEINNKDWSPDVHVNPNVTVVDSSKVEVNVTTDTAKAPKEILDFLKGVFGGMDTTGNYNPSDTAGTGTREGDLIAHLDSQVNGGVPDMRDSLPHAVTGVKGALTGLKDSINNSSYGDSLAVWQNQLLNNGVITGNGSNDCPAPLRRTFSWDFGPKIGTVQLGSLRFICEDAFGLGFSLWALARTLLRAMVAVCCMLWIYREVAGTGGSSNDED